MNHRTRMLTQQVAIFLSLGLAATVVADDWPQWLGLQRDVIWRESGILKSFPENGPPLRWKVPTGGGYSSPAIANGRVFLMDRQSDVDLKEGKEIPTLAPDGKVQRSPNFVQRFLPGKERILCFRESDGAKLWQYEYDCPYTQVARYAIGPRCTPTVDGDRIYTLGAEGKLLCVSVVDGTVLWSRDFPKDFGAKVPIWGFASHPLVDGDRLICTVGGEGAVCVAFDKLTGRELWRSMDSRSGPGYCAPVIYKINGTRQLIIWHGNSVNGLNPENGRVYWSVPFQARNAMPIGAPQKEGNQLFMMAHGQKSAMIELSDFGRTAEIAWEGNARRGIGGVLNTAVVEDGHVYACGKDGRYICARLDTGEQLWSTFEPSTGKRPAPWANVFTIKHEDRFFLANDLGDLIIAKMSPDGYEEVDRVRLIDPTHEIGTRTVVWSHPSFANRSVYLRNDKELRCYSLADSAHSATHASQSGRQQEKHVAHWSGTWQAAGSDDCKELRCQARKVNCSDWEATFTGVCDRRFSFQVTMKGRESNGRVDFQGKSDLGQENGGVYTWSGRIVGELFTGDYQSTAGKKGTYTIKPNREGGR